MGMVLLIIVLLAAVLTIASGVWVAVGLIVALRHRNGATPPVEDPSPADPA